MNATQATIVPCRYWHDPVSNRRFSPFTSWKPETAVLVTKGYTISWPDGTQGCGRPPFDTIADAETFLAGVPQGFKGMNVL
jgi:hypothetical protein